MITALGINDIFVFGSNTLGIHGAGAAKQAKDCFGAKQGIGEGPTGQCYAIPTLTAKSGRFQLFQRSEPELRRSIAAFYRYAEQRPDLSFLLTKEIGRAHV